MKWFLLSVAVLLILSGETAMVFMMMVFNFPGIAYILLTFFNAFAIFSLVDCFVEE